MKTKPFFARFLETEKAAELQLRAPVAAGAAGTPKYPSDTDDITLKYPSDADEPRY